MATPVVRMLESQAERTVVRVQFPVDNPPTDWQAVDLSRVRWALPPYVDDNDKAAGAEPTLLAPRLRLSLAVPTRLPVKATVREILWWKEPTDVQGLEHLAGDLVRFSNPVVARSVPLTGTDLPLAKLEASDRFVRPAFTGTKPLFNIFRINPGLK